MKPQLAADADLDAVQYHCAIQPKIDGVRAMNLNGTLTGRSLDPFAGFGITEYFSRPEFVGLDGEMTLGADPTAPRLCSLTTGAMGRFKDVTEMADLHWWVFDFLDKPELSYANRFTRLERKIDELNHPRIHLVSPWYVAADRRELDRFIAEHSAAGYEGTIIRNPTACFKAGRPTKKGQELMRVKPWADAEILVTGITQGQFNSNEAKTNTLGGTERSSAKAGMVPNGQVGSIQGTLLADFVFGGEVLFKKGMTLTVGSGEMTVTEATHFWKNQDELVGHIVKFKHMPFGTKDLPRFPTYISHRLPEDM